jgi:hypothetical protein
MDNIGIKVIKQSTIQRLMLKLVINSESLLVCDLVVAFANRANDLAIKDVVHGEQLYVGEVKAWYGIPPVFALSPRQIIVKRRLQGIG